MKVAVIGAGIVGVSTAYELACDGHRVVVFERRGSVAAEASFAHGGLICADALVPWDVPSGFRARSPKPWRTAPASRATAWLAGGSRARQEQAHEASRLHLRRLAAFSRERLHALTRSLRLEYERADGHLMLLRTPKDLALVQPDLDMLAALGTRFEKLDAARARSIEPGLSDAAPLHAGIFFPEDEAGNCREFAHLLRSAAQGLGARFRFHTEVLSIRSGPTPQLVHRATPPDTAAPTAPRGESGASSADDALDTRPMSDETITENVDAVVVCAALGANDLLAPHGLQMPWKAVHGHSITAPLRTSEMFPDQGPRAALTDAQRGVSISRLGHRVRVVGSFEAGGQVDDPKDGAFAMLFDVLHDWFPGVARLSHVQRWKGTLTLMPDGAPVLGVSGFAGVWLNLGHGANGWALACGSARLLADAVGARPSSIELDGLDAARLSR